MPGRVEHFLEAKLYDQPIRGTEILLVGEVLTFCHFMYRFDPKFLTGS